MHSSVHSTDHAEPQNLTNVYRRFYRRIYAREPQIRHMGGQWYNIDGKIMHHRMLIEEVQRLSKLARQSNQPEKRLLVRVIEHLRRM